MRILPAIAIAMTIASNGLSLAAPDPRYIAEAQKDAPQSADHALTGRYEGSFILGQTVKAFDELSLPAGPSQGHPWDNKKKFSKLQTAEGKVTRTVYVSPEGRSSLEVFKNYRDAVAAKGYTPVFECSAEACGPSFFHLIYRWDNKKAQPLAQGYPQIRNLLIQAAFDQVIDLRYSLMKKTEQGSDNFIAIYAGVHRGGGMGAYSEVLNDRVGVLVQLVEAKPMETKMVTLKAEEITSDIVKDGRAIFYGIHFDYDKADIKPESEPQLAEMAKALKADPKLKVFVIGHTDNQGKLEYNTGLSQRRADAVVKALTSKYAIEAKRLTPRGLASLAPIASNRTDEGRAKNRRVEMVEQ